MAKKQKGKQKEAEQAPAPAPAPPPPPPPAVQVEEEEDGGLDHFGGLVDDRGTSWGGLTDVPEEPEGEASESDPWIVKTQEHESEMGEWGERKGGGGEWGGGEWGGGGEGGGEGGGGRDRGGGGAKSQHNQHTAAAAAAAVAAAANRNQAGGKKGAAAKGGGDGKSTVKGKRDDWGRSTVADNDWGPAEGAYGEWGPSGGGGGGADDDWAAGGGDEWGGTEQEWEQEEDDQGWDMPPPPPPPPARPQPAKSGWTTWGEEAKRLPKVTITPPTAPEAAVGSRTVLSPQQRSQILNSLLNQPTQSMQQISYQDYAKGGYSYQQYHPQQWEQQQKLQHQQQQANQHPQKQSKQQQKTQHPQQQHQQHQQQHQHQQHQPQQHQHHQQQHQHQQRQPQEHQHQQQQQHRQHQPQELQYHQEHQQHHQRQPKEHQPQHQNQQQGGGKKGKKKKQQQEQEQQTQSQQFDPWGNGWGIPEEEEERHEIDDGWNRRVRFSADVVNASTHGFSQFGAAYNSPGLLHKSHMSEMPHNRHDPSGPTYSMPSKTLAHAYRGTTTSLHAGFTRNGMNDYADVRFIESKGKALEPVHRAFFGKERLARDRIHWMFPSDKDDRVASLLSWIQDVSYNLGGFGLHKFLQTRERGALIANADYRPNKNPNEAAFDWLTFDDLQPTMDRILQESVALYDPAVQVIVFVCLPSKSGKSMAMWRRKVNVPNNLRLTYQEEIMLALAALRNEKDYVVHVDELPKKKEAKPPPPKKHKWWHIRWS